MRRQLAAAQKAGADGDAAASAAAAAQKAMEDEIAALKKQVSSQEVVQRVVRHDVVRTFLCQMVVSDKP